MVYRSELRRIPPRTVPLDQIAEPSDPRAPAGGRQIHDDPIRRAVLALPAKYREALTLFYFHEKDLAQTARSLGVPEGTVKARLNRGREILREKLPRLLGELDLEKGR